MTETGHEPSLAYLNALQEATRRHRHRHGCNAYTFEDGAGLLALTRAEGAVRILELGTAVGYTACILASATRGTHVDTIERDAEHVLLARRNIAAAGLTDRVKVHEGDFMAVMVDFVGPYDLAFFDGLGPTRQLVERLGDLLKPGGLLVCSNLIWAASTERRRLTEELGRTGRWSAAGTLENGATGVFRKPAQDRPAT